MLEYERLINEKLSWFLNGHFNQNMGGAKLTPCLTRFFNYGFGVGILKSIG